MQKEKELDRIIREVQTDIFHTKSLDHSNMITGYYKKDAPVFLQMKEEIRQEAETIRMRRKTETQRYPLSLFLEKEDRAFVLFSFDKLMDRVPTEEELLNGLTFIRGGEYAKVIYVAGLAASQECRNNHAAVEGIEKAGKKAKLMRKIGGDGISKRKTLNDFLKKMPSHMAEGEQLKQAFSLVQDLQEELQVQKKRIEELEQKLL